nr:uncharacterized protein LOC105482847 [Macaca nemestrina]
MPKERYRSSTRKGEAGWTGLRVRRIDFREEVGGQGASGPSKSGIHPRTGGAKQTGLRSQAQRHIVRSCGSYLRLRARPGGGPSGPGAARKQARRAAATPAGEGRGRPRAGRRPPNPRGRQRCGSPAGHCAAARRVLLLGRRRLQPSSQRRAAPGVKSTFSRSFPYAALREVFHTHALHPQTARSLRGKKRESERKGWWRQKPDRGAQTWESLRSGGRAGGRAPAARGQLSLSGEAPQPPQRPAGLASLAPTLRPGAGGGGDPSSHFGSPGRG